MALEIQSELHNTLDQRLAKSWTALLDDVDYATPFHTPQWFMTATSAFDNGDVRILEVTDTGETIAVVPLVRRDGRRYATQRRWLELGSLPYADYGDLVIKAGCEQQAWDALMNCLRDTRDCDGLFLGNLALSPFTAVAIRSASSGTVAAVRPLYATRVLRAENFRGKNPGTDKQFRKLARVGETSLEVLTKPDAILERLPLFFELHRERFAARGLQSPFEDERHMNFYCAIAENLGASGQAWLSVLSVGAQPAAMRLSLRYKNRLHLYGTCFSQAFARYSPSVHQLDLLLAYAFEHGIDVVDFGMGESPHKEIEGTELTEPMVAIEVYRTRTAYLEAQVFYALQAARKRSGVIERIGKLARRLLPQRV